MRNKFVSWTAATLGTAAALAFGAGIVGSAMEASASDKYADSSSYSREGSESGVSGPVLSMDKLTATLKEQGYSEIYKVEREHGVYEVKARDPKGLTVKLYVDLKSGRILRQKKYH